MRICHCHGITDRELEKAVRSVAYGSSDDASALLAGSGCGGCLPLVNEITNKVLAERVGAALSVPRIQFPILSRDGKTEVSIQATVS